MIARVLSSSLINFVIIIRLLLFIIIIISIVVMVVINNDISRIQIILADKNEVWSIEILFYLIFSRSVLQSFIFEIAFKVIIVLKVNIVIIVL